MIIVKIVGGFGNQLYQGAMCLVLKKLYPEQVIKVDITHYGDNPEDNDHGHGFLLNDLFGLNIPVASKKEIKSIYHGFIPNKLHRRIHGLANYLLVFAFIRSRLFPSYKRKFNNFVSEDFLWAKIGYFNGNIFNLDKEHDYYFEGYWQSMEYIDYSKTHDIVKNAFKNPIIKLDDNDKKMLNDIRNTESICIHIRRGDVLSPEIAPTRNLCSENYYSDAIKIVTEKLKQRNKTDYKFFIVSNEIEWCKKEYAFLKNAAFISHAENQCGIDWYLMQQCRHVIMSDSTFSFWAAFVCENPDKIIVYPKFCWRLPWRWVPFSAPPDWIQIDNGWEMITQKSTSTEELVKQAI